MVSTPPKRTLAMAGPEGAPNSTRRKDRGVFIIHDPRVIRLQIVVNDVIVILDRARIGLRLCTTRGGYREERCRCWGGKWRGWGPLTLWSGGRPVVVGRHNSKQSGLKKDLKMLVRHFSREYRSVQGFDWISGVSWLLYATVSKGLEVLGGCAHHSKRTRSAPIYTSLSILDIRANWWFLTAVVRQHKTILVTINQSGFWFFDLCNGTCYGVFLNNLGSDQLKRTPDHCYWSPLLHTPESWSLFQQSPWVL